MRALTLLGLSVIVAACSAEAGASAPAGPAFDVAAVQANLRAECEDPIVLDELLCTQVDIDGLSADEDILYVPTTLNADADQRAGAICDQLALAHFDGDGNDLGYKFVGILDRDGGNAAACSV
jgi:hypothetical protein